MTLNEQDTSQNVNPELEVPAINESAFEGEKKGLAGGALPIWAIGAMVLLLVVLAAVLLFRGSDNTDTEWRQKVEAKLRFMEDRLVKLEEAAEGPTVTTADGPVKAFEIMDQRMNALEANLANRVSTVENRLEALAGKVARQPARTQPAASEPAKAQSSGPARSHVVKQGETFYSISRTYNMTVDDLLKLNNMKKTDIIKPGQKLAVGK